MGDPEEAAPQPGLGSLLPSKEFLASRKGQLLLGELVLSLITFICYVASSAVAFMTVPLLEFLLAVFYFYAYSSKLNEKFKGIHWPVSDFIRCVTAAIIYFSISIAAVAKYYDGASKAAGKYLTLLVPLSSHLKGEEKIMHTKRWKERGKTRGRERKRQEK
ncbi:CKLF-like MARVEL transmembrane domain-containing protein 3 isoform X2 [Ambystoma mexicanum]|uniref:CKLF-like MARVEL transmembrane domain-containing protein 3 isoform X2 n=1 Tax=Ambystoma mexicanum TaxID=8296 RepID=UPI0037E76A5B